jgi:hypothetical protein
LLFALAAFPDAAGFEVGVFLAPTVLADHAVFPAYGSKELHGYGRIASEVSGAF